MDAAPARFQTDWTRVAKRRIINILVRRKVCSVNQLDSKISESGPAGMRAQPNYIGKALKELISENVIKKIPKSAARSSPNDPALYALSSFDPGREKSFLENVLFLHRKHLFIVAHKEYCSDILENVTEAAIVETKKYLVHPRRKDAPLDIEIEHRGIPIGIDCKNRREWMYPSHKELWDIFKKCVQKNAVPVVITRKIPYVTYLVLGKMGGFGYQTHRQYFSPTVARELTDIQHRDKLGYKDVIVIEKPTSHMVHWFDKTLPDNLSEHRDRFSASQEILRRYAIDRKLGEKINDSQRITTCQEFLDELFPKNDQSEDDQDEPDYGDYYE